MPDRLATRGPRTTAGATRKTARHNVRESDSIPDTPDEGKDTTLRRAICLVFAEAQRSTAAHRKAIISLRKVQETCCYEAADHEKQGSDEDREEADFNHEIVRCVLRLLPVRKAEPVGDRVIRFLGTFLSVANDKDNKLMGMEDGVPETPTSRLTTVILSTLLPLLSAKDKAIRFRATQITSHIINSMDTLDDSLFRDLKQALLKRIYDKEAPVRLQAVYGLGRLAAEVEDDHDDSASDSDDEARSGVLEKLLNVLQNDPAAEVRRNLLLNLPLTKEVLPYLLERARDADGSTRRALYAKLLPALGDFRHLSLTHREKLLRWGLRDRDEHVRKATARLFCERWIEDCAALPADEVNDDKNPMPSTQAAKPSLDALLELLERIDIVNSGVEGGIAQVAMKEFWRGRPDYVDYVSFPDSFWEDLSPELVFVARTFNDFCRTSGKEEAYDGPRALDVMVEEKLPEVTKFGFLLERELVRLTKVIDTAAEVETDEEESVQREFVVEQMLHMALTFDYSDEVGRRKMSTLMRTALAEPSLPEEVTRLTVEILRMVCGMDAKGEREFCGIVLEAVAEVHDAVLGNDEETEMQDSSVEESFHSATSQLGSDSDVPKKQKSSRTNIQQEVERDEDRAMREIVVNMKCLHIALCMLENVQCALGTELMMSFLTSWLTSL
nr:condensin complex subunit 3 [Quercus suber]